MSHNAKPSKTNAQQNVYLKWYERILLQHLYALCTALGRLSRTPIATFMTIAVIGVALALPSGLLSVLGQAQKLINKWNQGTQVSIFLEPGASDIEVSRLMHDLGQDRRVAKVNYLPPSQVLKEFQDAAGLGNWSKKMRSNPLPGIIEITPAYHLYKLSAIEQFVKTLKQHRGVDTAQLDIEWVNRLQSIIAVVSKAALLLIRYAWCRNCIVVSLK